MAEGSSESTAWRNASWDELGRSFDERGPKLGTVRLLTERNGLFSVPERERLSKALLEEFGRAFDVTRTLEGLATVASALNAGDRALAAIATSLLPVPRQAVSAGVDPLSKASPDDPVKPGWPAGVPDSQGGKYRPKDGSIAVGAKRETERLARLERLDQRRGVRAMMRRVLTAKRLARLAFEAIGEVVPILDAVDSAAMIEDVAEVAAEVAEENADIDAAKAFVEHGPHTLEDLSVSAKEESFPSFDAFKKVDGEELAKRFGPAGDGYEYHHIVEQGSGAIPRSQLQSTSNIVRIPKILHEEITGYYAKIIPETGKSLRETLRFSSYEVRHEAGLQALRTIGALYP